MLSEWKLSENFYKVLKFKVNFKENIKMLKIKFTI